MKYIFRGIAGLLVVGLLITLVQIFPAGFLALWLLNVYRLGVTIGLIFLVWFLIKQL